MLWAIRITLLQELDSTTVMCILRKNLWGRAV